MDAVYLYKHSPFDDFELRYSLRSLAKFAPYIRKVWIFGDRPKFISEDESLIQHIPHEYTARIAGVRTPVTNFGLLMALASLIPELDFEYLQLSDDHFLLKDYPIEQARKTRIHGDMADATPPPMQLLNGWTRTLWRTADTLKYLGYTAYNFETHTPRRLTKKMVFEAYSDLRDFFTEDSFYGVTGPTAILNHAYKNEKVELTLLKEENQLAGFWSQATAYKAPTYEEVKKETEGKTFLNFNDGAFGDGLRQYLMEKFPEPSKYEKASHRGDAFAGGNQGANVSWHNFSRQPNPSPSPIQRNTETKVFG